MAFRWDWKEHWVLARHMVRWAVLATPVALATGAACAFFLWVLDLATRYREGHPAMLWGLPVAGAAIAWVYGRFGKGSEGGNNLLMDAIHAPEAAHENDDSAVVPRRLAPLILAATVVTHFFGGSAGREGTAVQMGGALAAGWARTLRLTSGDTRMLLMCGIAAGFAGVFGTPLAGTIFALEVLTVGRLRYDALIPCLLAALVGDWTSVALGARHTHYHIAPLASAHLDWGLAAKVAVASVAFGLAATLFAEVTHGIGAVFKKRVALPWLRPVLGGGLVIALVYVLGTRDYLGLGVHSNQHGTVTIMSAFHAGGAAPLSWWWKLLFTALTLGSGFKGGEVTPLFFVGATLGNTLSGWLQAPVDLFAGLGFIAVFAGATNTPLACTLMGIELFGAAHTPYYAIACCVAFVSSGHSGIYLSQRVGDRTLRELKERREGN